MQPSPHHSICLLVLLLASQSAAVIHYHERPGVMVSILRAVIYLVSDCIACISIRRDGRACLLCWLMVGRRLHDNLLWLTVVASCGGVQISFLHRRSDRGTNERTCCSFFYHGCYHLFCCISWWWTLFFFLSIYIVGSEAAWLLSFCLYVCMYVWWQWSRRVEFVGA